jgi:hypothetical protein
MLSVLVQYEKLQKTMHCFITGSFVPYLTQVASYQDVILSGVGDLVVDRR